MTKCYLQKMLLKKTFCQDSILTEDIGEHFGNRKRAFHNCSLKTLSSIPWQNALFLKYSSSKDHFEEEQFVEGYGRAFLREQIKAHPPATISADQLISRN